VTVHETSFVSALQCTRCGAAYAVDHVGDKSCADDGYLVARYDLARGARSAAKARATESSLWRYASMLPVRNPDAVVSLGEGWTPLIHATRAGAQLGCTDLHIKDEGRNPSGTFKDRGASVAISRYRELGVRTVILHSSGNAGAAWSLYAARAGLQCVAILPSDVADASLAQCAAAGARTYVCEDWHEAGRFASDLARRNGWLNVGTLKEPYRVEGKKTMGYEIAEQLGWSLPDAVFYPVGGGTGAIAIWKAFAEMRALGWVDDHPVRLFVSQYEGCAPIVKAFEEDRAACSAWGRIDIPPGGLKSPDPPGGSDVLALIRKSGGAAVAVSADEARRAVRDLARSEGLFVGLEAATTFAALAKALERGLLDRSQRVVLVATGSGLKSVPSLAVERPRASHAAEDSTMI
jgi:threonine synthase